jgi:hypothetical protein
MNDTVSATYNGWSNRETWLVSLWLNNDPASYDLLQTACKRAGNTLSKSEWLESELQDEMCDLELEASLWSDLLGTSLARVNWLEVIENN